MLPWLSWNSLLCRPGWPLSHTDLIASASQVHHCLAILLHFLLKDRKYIFPSSWMIETRKRNFSSILVQWVYGACFFYEMKVKILKMLNLLVHYVFPLSHFLLLHCIFLSSCISKICFSSFHFYSIRNLLNIMKHTAYFNLNYL